MSSGTASDSRAHGKPSERGIGQFIVYTLILIFFIGAGLRWRSQQEVRSVRFHGLQYVSETEVRSKLDSSLIPRKMSDVQLNEVRLALMKVPFIANASVQRSTENDIEIFITERKPLALVVSSAGVMHYIDDSAVLLPYRLIPGGSDVPVVRGIDRNGNADTTVQSQVCALLAELRRVDDGQLFEDVSELRYEFENQTVTLVTSLADSKILFGGFDNRTNKITKLSTLLRYISKQNDSGAASLIDVRWTDKVFVTKRLMTSDL